MIAVHPVSQGVYRIVVRVKNVTPLEDAGRTTRKLALMRSLISAHLILGAQDGEFVSLLDPPENLRDIAVTLGYDNGVNVEVTSGISGSDVVAINAGQSAHEGEIVQPVMQNVERAGAED